MIDDETTPVERPALVARHFVLSEFACHDGTPYPAEWVHDRLQPLVTIADLVRDEWGGRLHVRSGFRTDAWNRRIGGAPMSFHVEGRAVDLAPDDPRESIVLHRVVLTMWGKGAIPDLGGLGNYPDKWIHIDTGKAPDGHLRRWQGSKLGDERP